MKTVADLKRFLKVGQTWNAFYHPFNKTMGDRKIKTIMSTKFSFETVKGESWLDFPKAKNIRFLNETDFQIFDDEELILTYRFLGELK